MNALPELRSGEARIQTGVLKPFAGFEIPYGIVEGSRPGPCLLVTAGVHGSEYCSIEAALRLMRRHTDDLAGVILILPIVNMTAFRKRAIYVIPEDGRNLNRMFPGRADGSFSEQVAHWLVSTVYPKADAYLDLHGGDLNEALLPFSLFPRDSDASRDLAVAFGLPIAVAAGGEGYTINAAGRLDVPSIIAEVGGNGLWDERSVGAMADGIERVLRHLRMADSAGPSAPPQSTRIVTMSTPAAGVDGLWYPAHELGKSVDKQQVLGEIRDIFGNVLERIEASEAGSILYRLSSLAVNKGEALLGIGAPFSGETKTAVEQMSD